MSKHLLRKLLNLETVDRETNNTSNDNDNDNKKYSVYYSTDKGRKVVTKIPKHMNISTQSLPEQSTNTYTDDLSDVSSHLLKSIIRKKNNYLKSNQPLKPLTYYSTDKNSYVTTSVPERMTIQGSQDNDIVRGTFDEFSIPEQSEQSSFNYAKKFPSIYSDVSSKYSGDFSNHSSFNSNQDTSYDSFYDNLFVDKRNSDAPSLSPFNIFKESHRQRPRNKSDVSDASSLSPFNIFKESHRQRPRNKSDVSDVSDVSDASSLSPFNIFKESYRQRPRNNSRYSESL